MAPILDDKGRVITTHSMLKTMARCPKKYQYNYEDKLQPRYAQARDKPLKRGTWFHALLEEYYSSRDWMVAHKQMTAQFNNLFDEEKEALGDLPNELEALMRSYLWHYGANKEDPMHGWDVLGTEEVLECEWPDGLGIYRGKVDLRVNTEHGMFIVDHKSHKSLPDMTYRLLDFQSALYIWAAWEMGYPVKGFIWNYVKTKPPTKPALVDQKRTPRLTKSAVDTDYPTMFKAIKEYGLELEDYRDRLIALKRQRWKYGEVQTSPFFRRDVLEKDEAMIARVVASAMRTRDRIAEYGWNTAEDSVERVVDRSCSFMCGYKELCTTELFSGDGSIIRRQQFKEGDPMAYYGDRKNPEE